MRLLWVCSWVALIGAPGFADTTLIRTFVNGNTVPVHDIHIEYTQPIARAFSLAFERVGIGGRRLRTTEVGRSGTAVVPTVDFTFPDGPVQPGDSVTIRAITERDTLGIRSWRWTDVDGNPVVRTVTVGSGTLRITDYQP